MIDTLYILAAGRSGSTLLDLVIGSHPNAIAVGEITHLPKNLALDTQCMCGEPVRSCPLWADVVARLSASLGTDIAGHPYSLQLGFIDARRVIDRNRATRAYRVAWQLRHKAVYISMISRLPLPRILRREFDRGIAQTYELYEAVRQASGCGIVVDASKSALKGIPLHLHAPQRSRLIFLTRDGRAVLNSRLRAGLGRAAAVDAWQQYYRHCLPLLERVPEKHYLHVRYEDLAKDPAAQVARICEFAGMSYDAGMLKFGAKRHHVTNGNDMRFRADTTIRLDTAWQSSLSQSDLQFFESRAGELNRRFGYG